MRHAERAVAFVLIVTGVGILSIPAALITAGALLVVDIVT